MPMRMHLPNTQVSRVDDRVLSVPAWASPWSTEAKEHVDMCHSVSGKGGVRL